MYWVGQAVPKINYAAWNKIYVYVLIYLEMVSFNWLLTKKCLLFFSAEQKKWMFKTRMDFWTRKLNKRKCESQFWDGGIYMTISSQRVCVVLIDNYSWNQSTRPPSWQETSYIIINAQIHLNSLYCIYVSWM